jgi:outer membrane lipoprotein-sorting protein
MKIPWNVIIRYIAIRYVAFVGFGVLGAAIAFGQAPAAKPLMAEEVFKNVQVLKGIPVDEFMGTMGIFSAALGISCENCHSLSDKSWADYALDATEKKKTARRMVVIMQGINKNYFGGRQVVTCFSCHRGSDHPKTTPDLGAIYGAPPEDELDDAVEAAKDQPTPDEILDKYIQAIGGMQKVAAITSVVAKGTSSGYGPESGQRGIEIYAKAPNMRTQIIHTDNGDSTTTTDGRQGWISAPLRPVPVMELTGGELDGAKADAAMAFPGALKQAFTQWRTGGPEIVNDKRVLVIQGIAGNGTPGNRTMVTLYFDPETGLLVRMRRYAASVVGRMPTEYDYSDYRDVNGVKMPFKWTMMWLDGRESVELSEIQLNTNIDGARFAKPAPAAAPKR